MREDTTQESGHAATGVRSRRQVVRGAAFAVVGAVAVSMKGDPAGAANGDPVVIGSTFNGGTAATGIGYTGTSALYGLGVTDNGLTDPGGFPAVFGHAREQTFNAGVKGLAEGLATAIDAVADGGIALQASSAGDVAASLTNTGTGRGLNVVGAADASAGGTLRVVHSGAGSAADFTTSVAGARSVRVSHQGYGPGVLVVASNNASSSAFAIQVNHFNTVDAVVVNANATTTGVGVKVAHAGTGAGVTSTITNANSTAHAVVGVATKGSGVRGQGQVGGNFAGSRAQIRLNKSTAASPPASGTAGDFFVDSSARLWFCKGGSNWIQLA